MPKGQIAKRENLKLLKKLLMVLAVVFLLSILMNGAALIVKWIYNNQIEKQSQQISELSIAEKFKAAYEVIDKKLKYREGVFNQIHDSGTKISKIIDTIETIIPSDISLKKFDIDDEGKVTIEGTGDNADSILDFYHSLKISGLGDPITFNSIKGTFGDPKGLDFIFTFKLTDGK